MRRAGITQKDIDNARKSQEMNIIEDCKKFRHIHNHIIYWIVAPTQTPTQSKGQSSVWISVSAQIQAELFRSDLACRTLIGHVNIMSDGYEIKERPVKIWIMLIMKGQLFFILLQHTDILSWLDICYHKEWSKLPSEKLFDTIEIGITAPRVSLETLRHRCQKCLSVTSVTRRAAHVKST